MAGKLLDSSSAECILSELNLFEIPPTQTGIERSQFFTFNPITSPDRNAPLDFEVTSSVSEGFYIDPNQIWLYTKNRIINSDHENLPEAGGEDGAPPDRSVVYPIADFHNTRFRALDVHLNGHLITSTDNMYAYRSYLETLLTHTPEETNERLALELFHRDKGETDDLWNETRAALVDGTTANSGALARFNKTKFSRAFETLGRLHFGLGNQETLLPPGAGLKIKLSRSDHKFCLMARPEDQQYIIHIDKASLFVQCKKIANHVQLAHEETFIKMNGKYPIAYSEIRHFGRGNGIGTFTESNIIVNSLLPNKVIVGLVETRGFTGHHNYNPFHFKHFNVREVILRVNGLAIPFERIQTDFEASCYSQAYFTLLQSTQRTNTDKALAISYRQYGHGNTLFGFDISPDGGESNGCINLQKEGNLSLDIVFNAATDQPITVVVYMQFSKIIELERSGNVHVY